MRPTETILGLKARKAIAKGVNLIYEAVRLTLGPQGQNFLLYRTLNRGNRLTNDGYTVAECIEPKDKFVRMAAETFKEACKRTNEKVGDNTTTTAVIGGKLFNNCYNILSDSSCEFLAKSSSKLGVVSLKKNILSSAEKVKDEILKKAKKIKTLKDLERIATISIEDEEVGKIVAKMAWDVGVDGYIDVVEGFKGKIETEVIKGMRFPAKIAGKAFINRAERYEMVAEDCPVLITNYKVDNAQDLSSLKEINDKETSKLIIIAPAFSDNVLLNIIMACKNGFFIYPVVAPSLRTDQFEDLSVYCGATFINKDTGKRLKNIQIKDLGFLEKLIVKDSEVKDEAVATGGAGCSLNKNITDDEVGFNGNETKEEKLTPIQERIKTLKGQLEETRQEQFKNLLKRRIASISSAVGIIKVGDTTQASSLYRKLKIEDGVFACKAALRGGYVKGGGLCLKEIADKMPDSDILKTALLAPYEQIQNSSDEAIEITDDIIDSAEGIYYSVEHAVGVVANLITAGGITAEIEEETMGDGFKLIAQQMVEQNITQKRKEGQMTEAQEAEYQDRYGGLNEEEFIRQQED